MEIIMMLFSSGVTLMLIFCFGSSFADQTPFWAIYHLSNDEKAVSDGLGLGANAYETDVQFGEDDMPSIVLHTSPCFRGVSKCDGDDYCTRQTEAIPHIQHLRDMSTPNHTDYDAQFSGFVWLDLKVKLPGNNGYFKRVGKNLANVMVDDVFVTVNHDSRLKCGLEVYGGSSLHVYLGLADQLKKRDREDILKRIVIIDELHNHHDDDKITGFWASSGCSDCNLTCGLDFEAAKEASSLRDSGNQGVDKVVRWTIDVEDHIRENLRVGIDAFCTNHPETVGSILKEDEFKELFRLATNEDKICGKCDA